MVDDVPVDSRFVSSIFEDTNRGRFCVRACIGVTGECVCECFSCTMKLKKLIDNNESDNKARNHNKNRLMRPSSICPSLSHPKERKVKKRKEKKRKGKERKGKAEANKMLKVDALS